MGNLAAFKRLGGGCYLGVSLIVDRKNASRVEETVRRLWDLGVDSVKVSPCVVSNNGRENNAYHEPIYRQVRQQIESLMQTKASLEVFDAYHGLDDKFDKSYTWCPFLQLLCVIGADLGVYACQDKAYSQGGMLGSIKNQRFSEFWNDGKEKFYSINPRRDCSHHCVANRKNKLLCEFLAADFEHRFFV